MTLEKFITDFLKYDQWLIVRDNMLDCRATRNRILMEESLCKREVSNVEAVDCDGITAIRVNLKGIVVK